MGLVRTHEECDRERHTHVLEIAEGQTCQDTERKRPSEEYSLPGECRKGKSVHGNREIMCESNKMVIIETSACDVD